MLKIGAPCPLSHPPSHPSSHPLLFLTPLHSPFLSPSLPPSLPLSLPPSLPPLSISDIEKIHDGIGDKVALFVQWIATFFGGFIIGFVKEWRLTLLLVAFTPFLAICGAFFSVVSSPVGRCKIFLFHTILFLSPSFPPSLLLPLSPSVPLPPSLPLPPSFPPSSPSLPPSSLPPSLDNLPLLQSGAEGVCWSRSSG